MKGHLTAGHALAFVLGWLVRGGGLTAVLSLPFVLVLVAIGAWVSLPGLVRWLVSVAVVAMLVLALVELWRQLVDAWRRER